MPETTKIQVETSRANGMEDGKDWLTIIRTESAKNAQNVFWVAFHTNTESSSICTDFLFIQHYLYKENPLNLPPK